jgi:EAL domain-containing protein (putative c-di-GMP-specific phosphodiesterase class I)
MATSLNLSVTAVGVEDQTQLDFLRKRGCEEVQGELFGSAMNAEDMTIFLKDANILPKTLNRTTTSEKLKVEGSQKLH